MPSETFAVVRFGLQTNLSTVNTRDISSVPASSETHGDAYFMVQLQKESSYFLTLGFLYMNSVVPISTTTTSHFISGSFYGGINTFFLEESMSLGLFFSPYVQGDYYEGNSNTEVWGGSAFMAKINLHPKISHSFFIDLSLSYYSANYTTKSASTPVSRVESFGQTVIMPMIGFEFLY